MRDYENGVTTRKDIVSAAQKLFYENGFHETSQQAICSMAHVNRGTIYYHFKTKEEIRYEVLWNFTMANRQIVETYCAEEKYHYLLALCMVWVQITRDSKMRKFMHDYCADSPVYSNRMDLSLYHSTLYQCMWGSFWDRDKIPEISFASVYGYLISCCQMLCQDPEKYDPVDLFIHCNQTCLSIWGVPPQCTENIWGDIRRDIAKIPDAQMVVRLPD